VGVWFIDAWAVVTTIAGTKAGQVPGSFGVDNQLIVEKNEKQSTKR
jgi:hypothetical protein